MYFVRPGLVYDGEGAELETDWLIMATAHMLQQLFPRTRFPDTRQLCYGDASTFRNGVTPADGKGAARKLLQSVAGVYKGKDRFAAYMVYAVPSLSFLVRKLSAAPRHSMTNKPVVVVHGPAGSGKSMAGRHSVARPRVIQSVLCILTNQPRAGITKEATLTRIDILGDAEAAELRTWALLDWIEQLQDCLTPEAGVAQLFRKVMLDAEEQWEASQLIPLGCRMLDIDNVPFFGFSLADLSAAYTCGTGMQPPVKESEVAEVFKRNPDLGYYSKQQRVTLLEAGSPPAMRKIRKSLVCIRKSKMPPELWNRLHACLELDTPSSSPPMSPRAAAQTATLQVAEALINSADNLPIVGNAGVGWQAESDARGVMDMAADIVRGDQAEHAGLDMLAAAAAAGGGASQDDTQPLSRELGATS
ncbi:hypothetical protein COO60DRAFT_1634846 [Scenedesmus sp. NREL 46B-D3]|nr:hypothetical protein COO60DRAFT_1634846 [Scenedesmus sp. NREL 46B-D3]